MHDLFGIEFLTFELTFINSTLRKSSYAQFNELKCLNFFKLKNRWNNYKSVKAT